MGAIDLDPASDAEFNKTVKAAKFFDIEHNGLLQEWHGRVFLNPPFSYPLIRQFVTKLIEEYESGRMTEAIMLTDNKSDTKWFKAATDAATAVCFQRGRIRFNAPDGSPGFVPNRGQCFFYFGPNLKRFADIFGKQGTIMLPAARTVDSIGPEPVTPSATSPLRIRDLSPEDRDALDRLCPDLANIGPAIKDVMAWSGDHVLPEPLWPFTGHHRWVAWKWTPAEGDPNKLTKPPFQAALGIRHASNSEPSTWCDYARAKLYADQGLTHGVGFVLTDFNVCAFDLDDCFDTDGNLYPSARELVELCGSYCEWTPSRNGLRILGVANIGGKRQRVINMPEGWNLEVYEAGCARYITVSGKPFEDFCLPVANLDAIVAEFFKGHEAHPPAPAGETNDGPLDWAKFCSAVRAIPNDGTAIGVANWERGVDRDSIWVPLGACIYRTGHPDAWKLFLEFSKKSPKFRMRELPKTSGGHPRRSSRLSIRFRWRPLLSRKCIAPDCTMALKSP